MQSHEIPEHTDDGEQKKNEIRVDQSNDKISDHVPPIQTDNISTTKEDVNSTPLQLETPPELEVLKEKIELLIEKIDNLKTDLLEREESDKFKDEAIQRLSKQIEFHELGLMRKIKESLLRDLITFYDMIDSFQNKFQRTNDRVKLDKDINILKEHVEEILFRNDVNIIEAPEFNVYNREVQTVVQKVSTDSVVENNEIVGFVRQGFRIDNKILRKQEVIIKEFKPIQNN